MRALDLFCKAGGVSMGLHRAGFEVTGIDIEPQKNYPFRFIHGDAFDFLRWRAFTDLFDFIWASPPCQKYSAGRYWARGTDKVKEHPDLIGPIRELLEQTGAHWVIENVDGAPLRNAVLLCGSMFGLQNEKGYLARHRYFESSIPLLSPTCSHGAKAVSVCGHGAGGIWGHRKATAAEARELLGIDWMNRDELAQAIPPAYAQWIAERIKAQFEVEDVALIKP